MSDINKDQLVAAYLVKHGSAATPRGRFFGQDWVLDNLPTSNVLNTHELKKSLEYLLKEGQAKLKETRATLAMLEDAWYLEVAKRNFLIFEAEQAVRIIKEDLTRYSRALTNIYLQERVDAAAAEQRFHEAVVRFMKSRSEEIHPLFKITPPQFFKIDQYEELTNPTGWKDLKFFITD